MYERIRVLCKEFGYTIQALEKMASISNGTIGKWQKSYPRADYLQRVAKVLNTTLDYLITGEGPAHPQKGNTSEIIVPENDDVAAYLQKVKDEEGIMFDLSKVASLDEIKATVAFLKMLREQGRGS